MISGDPASQLPQLAHAIWPRIKPYAFLTYNGVHLQDTLYFEL